MSKRNLKSITIIFILTFVFVNLTFAQPFAPGDINGPYSVLMEGSVTRIDTSTGQSETIPTVSVGQFNADGNGNLTVKTVYNVGGFAILSLASTKGTYSISDPAAGIGTAEVTLKATAPPELPLDSLPPGIELSDTAIFQFRFIINKNKDLELIGTKFSEVKSGQVVPGGALVARGVAQRQIP